MERKQSFREKVCGYVKKEYGSEPEYLWNRFPDYSVFRHEDNRKWFGLIMDVPRVNLGLAGEERVDILNVKLDDPVFADMLVQQEGYLRGYHISKGNWISILLDGTVPFEEICGLIDLSFRVTASAKKKQKIRPPKEWLVPANPKYYDIEHAFDVKEEIDWKQGSGIKAGDTVFMYVAAPVSAVLYKCTVTETDIPFDYADRNLTVKALMKIKLQKRYDPSRFTIEKLKNEYGIYAVRGPRGIPDSLSAALKK
ncbi:MAG: MmcQ/YjbR family DNA-binding protein [Lachnospiraceae bacterium]|nr:MmcQ/YjbR family DNA-binding protein [Lachnospiraceae bacterium]